MTDPQLYLGIGLPIVAVLTSLILSLTQVTGIREDMRQMRREHHSDFQNLTGKAIGIDNRLTRIEERMENRRS
jgi:hypothetical protein